MGYWLNNPTPPQDMNSFEQWAWDKYGMHPDDLWSKVAEISILSVIGITILTIGAVVLVRWIKKRVRTEKSKKERNAKKRKTGKRVCLVKIQMTESSPDECEVVTIPKGEGLPLPDRIGYHFLGWFFDREYKRPFMPVDEITDNLILYAKWVKEGE